MTELTEDVRVLLGNHRRAVLSMVVPIALSSLLVCCNNIVDAVWVAGLGTAALAATGVFAPFYYMMVGIGTGIGIGANQAIARRIGSGDYDGTHGVASQALYMVLLSGILFALFMTLFSEPIMAIGGAGSYMTECMEYCIPIFLTAPLSMAGFTMIGLLRAEGAARRSMAVGLVGAVSNMVLDPIFIYLFGWGVAGAAWATSLSLALSTLLGVYWYFVKKDTFVRIPMRHFSFDRSLDIDILKVGVPATLDLMMLTLTSLLMNRIILLVDPVNGIAIYNTGWRALNLVLIPAVSLGNAIVSVCAAAYGSKNAGKMNDCYEYCVCRGTVFMLLVGLLTYLAAPLIAGMFTYGEQDPAIAASMAGFLRCGCIFIPLAALGYCSTSLLQSMGKGTAALLCTVWKHVLRLAVCALIATVGTLYSVWMTVAFCEMLGYLFAFFWAFTAIRSLVRTNANYDVTASSGAVH